MSESGASSISEKPVFQEAIEIIKAKINDVVGDARKRTNISETLYAASAAIPDLASGDPLRAVRAIANISSSVADMMGPEGVVVCVVLSLVSSILGCFLSSKAHDPPYYEAMKRVMQKYRREELFDKAGVLNDAEVFCSLSMFRDLVVKHKWAIIHLSDLMEDENVTKNDNVHVDDKQTHTGKLDFLQYPPTIKEAVVASVYDPDKWPMIALYMNRYNFPDPPQPMPDQQEMRTRSLGKSNWLYIPKPLYAENKKKPIVQFIKVGHYWILRCSVYKKVGPYPVLTNLYFRQPCSSSGEFFEQSDLPVSAFVKENVTDSNSIKVTFTQDKKCVLAPRCSPHRFFLITNGWVDDCLAMTEDASGISKEMCHWQFKSDK